MEYHFLGIGGIGMSALARIIKQQKIKVSGQDICLSSFVRSLADEGIEICDELPQKEVTVVYSSALNKNHPLLIQAKKRNLQLLHRSELLSILMKEKTSILISGTHGKTSTSALLSHVFVQAKKSPSFAVGGILKNYQTNGRYGLGEYFISEADESDGSFLQYPADFAILTNLEEDHLDYWKHKEKLIEAFRVFADKAKVLFWCKEDKNLQKICSSQISYGFDSDCDLTADRIYTDETGSFFDIYYKNKLFEKVYIPLFGKHNILNTLAVFGLCYHLNISEQTIRDSFKTYSGVNRRLEKIGEAHSISIYSDYAHHPTEVSVTLQSLREKEVEKRIICVFQPHRFSRIKQCLTSFQSSFNFADCVIITEIYSAHEKQDSITSDDLLNHVNHPEKYSIENQNLIQHLLNTVRAHDLVIFMGAGDIHDYGIKFYQSYLKTFNKLRVGIIYGGSSHEHEVSVSSAQFFFKNLNSEIYQIEDIFLPKNGFISSAELFKIKELDIAIPILHGRKGEDGMIQGLLEAINVAYVGCDYASCVICMDKAWTKLLAIKEGVHTSPFYEVRKSCWKSNRAEILAQCRGLPFYPLYVKGSHMGSSLGIKKVNDKDEIEEAIDYVFTYDDAAILEKEVYGKQLEFALWGNDKVQVGVPLELKKECFYSYKDKYEKQLAKIPADVSEHCLKTGIQFAIKMYKAAKCTGLARIDFFLTPEGQYVFNEINPMPGFTPTSAYISMVKAKNISESNFIDQLIILGLQRKRKCQIKTYL